MKEIDVGDGSREQARARMRAGMRYAPWLWVVGALLYAVVLWYVGWEDLRKAAGSLEYRWLAGMVVLESIVLWGRAGKWRLGMGRGHGAVGLYFLAKAGGNLTPGRVGELSPLLLARHRSPRTAAWIILDRLLEIAATLLLGALGAAAVGIVLAESLRLSLWMVVVGWMAAVAGMVFLPLFLVTRRSWLAGRAARLPVGTRLRATVEWLAEVSGEIVQFRGKVPLLAVLTLAATAADVYIGMMLYLSFGFSVAFSVLAAAQCLHALVTVIPITPNATGVPYLAAALLVYELAGVSPEVIALALPVRMVLGGALFWVSFAVAMGLRKKC